MNNGRDVQKPADGEQWMETNLPGVKQWLWQPKGEEGRGPGINGSVSGLLQAAEQRLGKYHIYCVTVSLAADTT